MSTRDSRGRFVSGGGGDGGVRVNVDLRDTAGPALARLGARAGALEHALDDIGGSLEASTQQRFQAEQDPEGRPWKRLSAVTLARRGAGAKILRDKADLFDSIGHRVRLPSVHVGANRTYARIQHMGGKAGRGRKVEIPARPYLGVSAADQREIVEILRDHLGEA